MGKILGRVGGYELLRGLGFKQSEHDENELVVSQVDMEVVNAAIISLQKRISAIKERKKQFGAKNAKVKKAVNPPAQNDEDKQLQEALRLSQEQHIKDMLQRQQKELDMAARANAFKAQKSVNMFPSKEEDDHKASSFY